MMLLRLLPLIFALLFILSQKIDVKVHRTDRLTVKINFNILALVLQEDKIKKNGLKSISRIIKNVKHFHKSIDYILSKSEVRLLKHEISNNETEVFSIIKSAYSYASRQFLISYLERNAKKFRIIEQKNYNIDISSNTVFDLDIHFSLWHLIISALILLYYTVKRRFKRLLKNV